MQLLFRLFRGLFNFVLISFVLLLDTSGSYGSTSKALIFSLRDKEALGPFKGRVTGQKHAIYKYHSYHVTFGYGHDIYIADNANTSIASYTNFSYSAPSGEHHLRTILTGTYNFFHPMS